MIGDVEIELLGHRKRIALLDSLPAAIGDALRERLEQLIETMEDEVRGNIQERLTRKAGALEDAVRMEVTGDGAQLRGRVFIEGVPYAKAQDKGAVIPAHTILPKNGKVLAFIAATGDKVFATRVSHPGAVIPPTYFMRDAYRKVSPKISSSLYYYTVRKLKAMGYG